MFRASLDAALHTASRALLECSGTCSDSCIDACIDACINVFTNASQLSNSVQLQRGHFSRTALLHSVDIFDWIDFCIVSQKGSVQIDASQDALWYAVMCPSMCAVRCAVSRATRYLVRWTLLCKLSPLELFSHLSIRSSEFLSLHVRISEAGFYPTISKGIRSVRNIILSCVLTFLCESVDRPIASEVMGL